MLKKALVVAALIVSKCELDRFDLRTSKYMCTTYLLSSIFSTSFCKYVKWG